MKVLSSFILAAIIGSTGTFGDESDLGLTAKREWVNHSIVQLYPEPPETRDGGSRFAEPSEEYTQPTDWDLGNTSHAKKA